MCNYIFIGCFCIVFHCNTYELYRPFSIQIVIHIGLMFTGSQYDAIVIIAIVLHLLLESMQSMCHRAWGQRSTSLGLSDLSLCGVLSRYLIYSIQPCQ